MEQQKQPHPEEQHQSKTENAAPRKRAPFQLHPNEIEELDQLLAEVRETRQHLDRER